MPVFEYKCNACGEDFEKLVFGKQGVTCPKCGSDDVRKKFSAFGMSGVRNPGSSGCSSCSSGSCSSCH
ncbi:MAG: zinc ribbon domain-containing protein [Nitrospirae bacterium]|nr:zinc ribbon domain-containing protein [Nitrospirota bacterium]